MLLLLAGRGGNTMAGWGAVRTWALQWNEARGRTPVARAASRNTCAPRRTARASIDIAAPAR